MSTSINIYMKCKWPVNHISISSTGVYRPCCAWQEQPDQVLVSENTIQDYLNSDFYKKLMDDMKNNRFGQGCNECVLDEKANIDGMIYNGDQRYTNEGEFSLFDTEIKFGNICNAGCIMCGSYNSSLMEEEHNKNPQLKIFRPQHHSPKVNWFDDPVKFRTIAVEASKARKIRFAGGEPTVRGLLSDFLEIVLEAQQENKNHSVIQITSNGGSFGKKLQDVLSKFEDVQINVSIDGYGKANDFIRWPIKWDKLERNVDKMISYDNIKVNVETSVQAASLQSLPKLIEWCDERNIHWAGMSVYEPKHLQPFLASPEIIQTILDLNNEKLTKIVKFNSSQDDREKLREKMLSYFETLNNIRGLNWKDHFDV